MHKAPMNTGKEAHRILLTLLFNSYRIWRQRRKVFMPQNIQSSAVKRYSIGEEIGNSITHGIGAALSCAAIPLLVVNSVRSLSVESHALSIVSMSICGSTMLFLYMMSTLYHGITNHKAKKVFGILDHCSIYVLIAGTYTPYCLIALGRALGWTFFGIEWGFVALGCTFYSIFGSRMRWISALTYLPMAWMIAFVWNKLSIPAASTQFLLAGGIAYSVGFIFYALKKIKWMHTVFHIFCLAGTICHFFSLLYML